MPRSVRLVRRALAAPPAGPPTSPPLLITVAEGARLLGLPETSFRRLIARGAVPPAVVVRFPAGSGGWLRLKRAPLLAWATGQGAAGGEDVTELTEPPARAV
jgi:hypothetical protein